MVFALAVPAYINQTISSSRGTWPTAQCRVELGGGPGRRVLIRCSLSMPGRRSMPGSPSSPRSVWFGSSGLVSKDFFRSAWSTVLQNHRVWSEKSLQTLQRVGTMLRSSSMDYIAALSIKKGASQQQSPDPDQPPESDQLTAGQLKASLSKFLTTASSAEVQQATMLSDLSNMAYDIAAIDEQQLQQRHNLVMVAHSRYPATAQDAEAVVLQREDGQDAWEQAPAAVSTSAVADEQLQGLPAAPASSCPVAATPLVWDAAPQYLSSRPGTPRGTRNSISDTGSAPASPRTPFIMSSMSEFDDLAGLEQYPATASAPFSDPGTPRRKPSAFAAATEDTPRHSRAVTPAAVASAEAPTGIDLGDSFALSRSSSADVAAVQPLYCQEQRGQQETGQQQERVLDEQEQQALWELQQQEQAVLFEMRQQQQLQLIMQQQLQQEPSTGGASEEAVANSPAWWWWWWQQQQAAAAASAGNSSTGGSAEAQPNHPTEWFVCDEAAPAQAGSPVRYFILQGSITLDHWRINLTIDPSEFEGGALGPVKVHRGVYEAALDMLDTFIPLVQEHLAEHPDGKVAFTGHSLGGSLATLLMLLLVHRGILPASNVATVRTFGAPAIFCEGATGSAPAAGACQSCSLPCQHRTEHSEASAAAGAAVAAAGSAATADQESTGLLAKLGLAQDIVVNVVMTRDIVPRAFVCDYTLVADFMRSWMPGFKEHSGLASCKEHKALYNFIGTVEVLQPSLGCPFMLLDETHSMLPEQPALYKLTEPCCNLLEAVGLVPADSAAIHSGVGNADLAGSTAGTAAEAASSRFAQQDDAAVLDQAVEESVAGLVAAVAAACNSCSRSSCSGCTKLQDSMLAAADGADTVAPATSEHQHEPDCDTLASRDSSNSNSKEESTAKKSKLGAFGSWGSLVSLGHLSLTAAIADLTGTFTLVSGNSGMVSIPAEAETGPSSSSSKNEPAAVTTASSADLAAPAAVPPPATSAPSEASAALATTTADPLGLTLGDAILTFMNNPHPLETLGEMRAYGPSGSISRFHNPNNYTVALQHLCRPLDGDSVQ